jgi:hypothetical protein
MSLFKNKKYRLSLVGLLLISLSVMAVFSIFLHDHEFDPLSTDEDCAPCHWTQINVDVDSDVPSVDFIPVISSNEIETGALHYKNFKYSYFGLSPPEFS